MFVFGVPKLAREFVGTQRPEYPDFRARRAREHGPDGAASLPQIRAARPSRFRSDARGCAGPSPGWDLQDVLGLTVLYADIPIPIGDCYRSNPTQSSATSNANPKARRKRKNICPRLFFSPAFVSRSGARVRARPAGSAGAARRAAPETSSDVLQSPRCASRHERFIMLSDIYLVQVTITFKMTSYRGLI